MGKKKSGVTLDENSQQQSRVSDDVAIVEEKFSAAKAGVKLAKLNLKNARAVAKMAKDAVKVAKRIRKKQLKLAEQNEKRTSGSKNKKSKRAATILAEPRRSATSRSKKNQQAVQAKKRPVRSRKAPSATPASNPTKPDSAAAVMPSSEV